MATFYGVRFPKNSRNDDEKTTADGREDGTAEPGAVVECKIEALKLAKSVKGSRFRCFRSEEEARMFVQLEDEEEDLGLKKEADGGGNGKPSGEGCAFPSLVAQELKLLKEAIMARDETKFHGLVDANPRYLVTTCDTPAILHSGTRANALHVATSSQSGKMVAMVLNKVQDSFVMESMYPGESAESRTKRMEHLLDLYLNMPNKGHNDTPLHHAAKFGCLDIVKLLVGFSSCNTKALNKAGHTPAEIACSRMGDYDVDVKKGIEKALEGMVYIPVIRDCDLSSPGYLGETLLPGNDVVPQCLGSLNPLLLNSPFPSSQQYSPNRSATTPTKMRLTPGSPLMYTPSSPSTALADARCNLSVQAFLGPLSPREVGQVRQEWKAGTSKSLKLMDPAKGLERQGRKVARSRDSSLFEYWGFLDCYTDLASNEGLRMLENHLYDNVTRIRLQREREVEQEEEDDANGNHVDVDPLSPVTQLSRDLEELRLTSPDQQRDLVNGNDEDEDNDDSSFFSLPNEDENGRRASDCSFETAEEGVIAYVNGSNPSVVDVQVLAALEDSGVTFECLHSAFTNVAAWMEVVQAASEAERKSWGRYREKRGINAAATRLLRKTGKEIQQIPRLNFEDDNE